MQERNDPFWRFVTNRLPGPPSSRFLGYKCLELDSQRGTIAVQFQPKPECLNPARCIAGGFIAEMLDETMATALGAILEPGKLASSVEFKVSFIRPARFGTFVGRARVVHRGSAIAFVDAELRTPENELVATSTQTMRIVTLEKVELDFGQEAV